MIYNIFLECKNDQTAWVINIADSATRMMICQWERPGLTLRKTQDLV